MLLAQFQERYPTASLLSKLLTIYQGKFVVQVSVQMEGVIQATGLAAAETIELAEDRARLRAISLIPLSIPPQVTPTQEDVSTPKTDPTEKTTETDNLESDFIVPLEDYPEFTTNSSTDYLSPLETEANSVADEDFGIEPIKPVSTVTPFTLRTATQDPQLFDSIIPEFPPSVPDPIDLSDTLIAIETELRNLRWTAKQERNYIERIYNKESRDLLSPQQLYEFLQYLQVFAQTSKELARLGWDNQQGQDYLVQNYNKKSRQYLTYQELQEFLQNLQAMSQ